MNKRLQARTEVSRADASRCGIGVVGQPGLEEGVGGRGGGEDLYGYRKLSVRKCACDAKVPNIPEVKVNRLLRYKAHHPLK